jgi:preprotein translocase SecE subunit
MANGSRERRKPRIRKATPTVREKIESEAKGVEKAPKRGFRLTAVVVVPLKVLWRILGPILRPLTPIGRLLLKILNWLVPRYFINSWRELKLVTWPNRRETWRLTGAVVVFSIVFGAMIWVVDLGLDQLFKRFVLK